MKPTYAVKNGKLVVCNNGAYLSFTPEEVLSLWSFINTLILYSSPLSQEMVDGIVEDLED